MSKVINKTTSMNIRLDVETRQKLQQFADHLGIPATTLAAANIKQMLRTGEVRLSPSLEPTPYLRKLIKVAESDYKAGKDITTIGNATELDAFFDSL
jgi:hypothetical protein